MFPQPVEYATRSMKLIDIIQSILLIKTKNSSKKNNHSFASKEIEKNFQDKNNHLSRYVLELDQKIRTLSRIKEQIKELYPDVNNSTQKKLTSIVNSIKVSVSDKKYWDDLKKYLDNSNPIFLRALTQKHPSLTPVDIKYCCFLKMGLSNDDIRHILGISQESVRTHKYRLKKKMTLEKDQDLLKYIKSLTA
ncbi:MAG: hypothetical protein KDD99_00935 [Bacteroidetes bacterium]|nr:hypothetical protein [Bacteroidota bacterium]